MRAVRYHEHGGEDVLGVEEIDRPTPGPGEVLVEVRAASVNPVDTKLRSGAFGDLSLPAIPGGDAAGVVVEVADGVEDFAVDDRVFLGGVGQLEIGTTAEYVAVPTIKAAHLPDPVSFEEGAAVPNVGATAWTALFDLAGLQPTDHCLVHGAAGGVGHVAVQLADAAGATVVGTAGSAEAREAVRELGASAALDYESDTLADDVPAAVEGTGMDVILDHLLHEHLETDLAVAARWGYVVSISGTIPEIDGGAIRGKDLTLRGMSMGNRPERRSILRKLATMLECGDLEPRVARTYDLAGIREAHRDVLAGGYVGKLIVTP